jgi:hypothetical protein
MANVPVGANQVAVEHRGNAETHFTNQAGDSLTWKVAFSVPPSGNGAGIFMDGAAAPRLALEHRPKPPARNLRCRSCKSRSNPHSQAGGVKRATVFFPKIAT